MFQSTPQDGAFVHVIASRILSGLTEGVQSKESWAFVENCVLVSAAVEAFVSQGFFDFPISTPGSTEQKSIVWPCVKICFDNLMTKLCLLYGVPLPRLQSSADLFMKYSEVCRSLQASPNESLKAYYEGVQLIFSLKQEFPPNSPSSIPVQPQMSLCSTMNLSPSIKPNGIPMLDSTSPTRNLTEMLSSLKTQSHSNEGLLQPSSPPKKRRSSDCTSAATVNEEIDEVDGEELSEENGFKRQKSSSQDSLSVKQKRTKWKAPDLLILWHSIAEHGNEWQKVKRPLTGRTYHQVKDKGKRMLHEYGWETGRSKVNNDVACDKAKSIAQRVLSSLKASTTSLDQMGQ